MGLIDRVKFWVWYKEIAHRMRCHPALPFMWEMRVEFVYKPLFKKKGLQAVFDEHKKHIEHIGCQMEEGLI